MKRQRFRKGLILVSFLLFPVTMWYFSPYLIIEAAALGVVSGSMITFAGLFVSSLVLGRGFCGWACPAAGLQEACFAVQDKRLKRGKRDWIKYFIWVPWMAGIALAAISAGGLTVIDPFIQTTYGISIAAPENYFVFYFFLALIVGLAFAVGRRAFCHYVCWMAPFMIIGRKLRDLAAWPSLRLVPDTGRCTSCMTCTKGCPQSIDVNSLVQRGAMEDAECILCGTCVDQCPQKAISFSFSSGTGS